MRGQRSPAAACSTEVSSCRAVLAERVRRNQQDQVAGADPPLREAASAPERPLVARRLRQSPGHRPQRQRNRRLLARRGTVMAARLWWIGITAAALLAGSPAPVSHAQGPGQRAIVVISDLHRAADGMNRDGGVLTKTFAGAVSSPSSCARSMLSIAAPLILCSTATPSTSQVGKRRRWPAWTARSRRTGPKWIRWQPSRDKGRTISSSSPGIAMPCCARAAAPSEWLELFAAPPVAFPSRTPATGCRVT